MPLGESFSFMQQTVTGLVPVPGMPGAGSRPWEGVQGGQGWSPEGQLGSSVTLGIVWVLVFSVKWG